MWGGGGGGGGWHRRQRTNSFPMLFIFHLALFVPVPVAMLDNSRKFHTERNKTASLALQKRRSATSNEPWRSCVGL